ncbi:MAG: hypothetical protein IKU44_03995, partial [Firmicutes bacterium]|nr:hypothetical protein [Bacillota bacterium]
QMNKGSTLADSIQQTKRLHHAGIAFNGTFIMGLAGKDRGEESGLATAALINKIQPKSVRMMTLSVFPNCELAKDIQEGTFVEAGEKEILTEEKIILQGIELAELHFWANHVLNSTPVEGIIGDSRDWMLKRIERSLEEVDDVAFKKTFKRMHL